MERLRSVVLGRWSGQLRFAVGVVFWLAVAFSMTDHINFYGRYDFTNPKPPPTGTYQHSASNPTVTFRPLDGLTPVGRRTLSTGWASQHALGLLNRVIGSPAQDLVNSCRAQPRWLGRYLARSSPGERLRARPGAFELSHFQTKRCPLQAALDLHEIVPVDPPATHTTHPNHSLFTKVNAQVVLVPIPSSAQGGWTTMPPHSSNWSASSRGSDAGEAT